MVQQETTRPSNRVDTGDRGVSRNSTECQGIKMLAGNKEGQEAGRGRASTLRVMCLHITDSLEGPSSQLTNVNYEYRTQDCPIRMSHTPKSRDKLKNKWMAQPRTIIIFIKLVTN